MKPSEVFENYETSEFKKIHDHDEHIKQTILIKLSPYLTDEQNDKLVEILKSV